jgi:hypothetical protein
MDLVFLRPQRHLTVTWADGQAELYPWLPRRRRGRPKGGDPIGSLE